MTNTSLAEKKESFADLLEQSLSGKVSFEGSVVKGYIVGIHNDHAIIDVGLKSEGRIALKEFNSPSRTAELRVGDIIDVFVERMEDKNGEAVLSIEKARRKGDHRAR